jgi:hypothetical protein
VGSKTNNEERKGNVCFEVTHHGLVGLGAIVAQAGRENWTAKREVRDEWYRYPHNLNVHRASPAL